jgi:hypothetical protein
MDVRMITRLSFFFFPRRGCTLHILRAEGEHRIGNCVLTMDDICMQSEYTLPIDSAFS